MSETTLPMAERRDKYNRREFLRKAKKAGTVALAAGTATGLVGAAGYGVGTVVGKVIGESVTHNSREVYTELQSKAKEMLVGDLVVSSNAEARNQTLIGPNLVDRKTIKKINGIEIDATKDFKITNTFLAEGGEPEGRFGKGDWYPALATMQNPFATWEEVIYFPTGSQAEQNGIKPDRDHGARFFLIKTREKDAIILENGSKDGLRIPKENIGLVSPLPKTTK